MTRTFVQLSEDDFDKAYTLRTNHLDPNASWGYGEGAGCLFGTSGDELAFVLSQEPMTVWTVIDGDDGDLYVVSGYHIVNRVGYLISTTPFPEGADIEVHIPTHSND